MSLFFCDADTNTEVTRFPVQIIPTHLSLHGSLPFQFDGLFFQLSAIAVRAEAAQVDKKSNRMSKLALKSQTQEEEQKHTVSRIRIGQDCRSLHKNTDQEDKPWRKPHAWTVSWDGPGMLLVAHLLQGEKLWLYCSRSYWLACNVGRNAHIHSERVKMLVDIHTSSPMN